MSFIYIADDLDFGIMVALETYSLCAWAYVLQNSTTIVVVEPFFRSTSASFFILVPSRLYAVDLPYWWVHTGFRLIRLPRERAHVHARVHSGMCRHLPALWPEDCPAFVGVTSAAALLLLSLCVGTSAP